MLRRVRVGSQTVEYELMQTPRASVELRVTPNGTRLFAPKSFPLRQADQFVRERLDWIREAQERLDAYRRREQTSFPMTEGTTIPFEGRPCALRLEAADAPGVRFGEGVILLRGPDLSPEAVRGQLEEALIARAKERFAERLAHYVPLVGRSPARVTVRGQRTRWGSCSGQGNIALNWKLIMAPPEALDYVVIHELCHLYEFNHSQKFWARVARWQPDYEIWRSFLRSGWAHPYN